MAVGKGGMWRVAVIALAVTLAASTLLPWYTSQALVDFDEYRGNPLPVVDWLVAALAALAAVVPRARLWAGLLGLASVGLTTLMMAGDGAQGVQVDPGVGLFIALAEPLD